MHHVLCARCICDSTHAVGTEEWTAGLGLPVKSPWTQWKYERSTAAGSIRGGYKVVYDSNDFTFQTM